jgi:hypothetical protein
MMESRLAANAALMIDSEKAKVGSHDDVATVAVVELSWTGTWMVAWKSKMMTMLAMKLVLPLVPSSRS